MFSYHPMTLIRAFLLMFVAAELFMVVDLLIQGIASLFPLAMRGAIFVYGFVSVAL
jgi:hypothetical protein